MIKSDQGWKSRTECACFLCPLISTLHVSLPYSLLWMKAETERLIGVHRYLDDLVSHRHQRWEENKVRIFISSAPSLPGDLGLALCFTYRLLFLRLYTTLLHSGFWYLLLFLEVQLSLVVPLHSMFIHSLFESKPSNYPALSVSSISCWYLTDTKLSQKVS